MLMSVMTLGTAVINMILPSAVQAGLVMRSLDNASWPTQETDLAASLPALSTAAHTQDQTHTDAIPQAIHAMRASLVILDAAQTGQLNAQTAKIQTHLSSSNATEPIQTIQSAIHAMPKMLLTAIQEHKNATVALQSQSSLHVTQRHSHASHLTTLEISNRPVTQAVHTSRLRIS